MEHEWDYCGVCHASFVKCGECGNNCCNGGYGTIDGKPCDACPSAYEMQATTEPPTFTEEYKAEKHIIDAVFEG